MRVEKWWNEICGRGKQEKPQEKPTQTPCRPPRNPHGGTETRTRDPSGGRQASNRLRHEAALQTIIADNMLSNLYAFQEFVRQWKFNAITSPLSSIKWHPKFSKVGLF